MNNQRSIFLSGGTLYLLVAIPIWAYMCYSAFYYQPSTFTLSSDYWEHSATINEWMKNLWAPENPHLATKEGTPRYMPFFFVVTIIARIFSLNAMQALSVAGCISITLFILGVYLFSRLFYQHAKAPVVMLIVLLSGWGIGWTWSNLYQLRSISWIISYPSFFAFSLTFIALWLTSHILRGESKQPGSYLFLGLIVATILTSHPLTGVFTICTVGLLALLESGIETRVRLTVLTTIALGSLAVELWPYFSVWKVVLGTSAGKASWIETATSISDTSRFSKLFNNHPFYRPTQVMLTLGPALLGIPALIFLALRRQRLFIVAGAIVMLLPYVLNLFVKIPLGHRFLFFFVFFLHLAIIHVILEPYKPTTNSSLRKDVGKSDRKLTIFSTILLIACLGWNTGLVALEQAGYMLRNHLVWPNRHSHVQPIVAFMERLSEHIPSNAVVLAPRTLSWPLPTFSGKVVSLYHGNPMVPDGYMRSSDTKRFFSANTTHEDRVKIIKRYNVTHILFRADTTPADVILSAKLVGDQIVRIGGFMVVSIGPKT